MSLDNNKIYITENNTVLNIINDNKTVTTLSIQDESVSIVEVGIQGVSGKSYLLEADSTLFYDSVELVAGENISIASDADTNQIAISANINLDDYALKADLPIIPTIPSKTSELTNDSNFIQDSFYVHTDNNYSNADQSLVATIPNLALKTEIPSVPSKTSELTNDSSFETTSGSQEKVDSAIDAIKDEVSEDGDTLSKLRTLIGGLQTLVSSDDVSLDSLQKIVAYIKNNKDLIDGITTNKLNASAYTANDVMSKVISQLDSTHRFVSDTEKSEIEHGETAYGWGNHYNALSTGLICGGVLSINGTDNTTFDMTAGCGIIVDNHTNPTSPTKTLVEWDNKVAVEVPYISSVDTTYVGIDINGDFVFRDVAFSAEERRDIIVIGWCDHTNYINLTMAFTEPQWSPDIFGQLSDFLESFGSFNITGNEYYPLSGLQIRRTAGKTFDNGTNYVNAKKSVNILPTDAENPVNEIYYYHRNSSGNWVNDNESVSSIDPNHYDTGLGLALVPDNKWTIQIVEFYSPKNITDIQYGQVVYNSYEEAKSALSAPIDLDPYNNYDTFRAWIIIKQGATDLTNESQAVFVQAGKLGLISVASGGGSGGEVNTASNIGLLGIGLFDQKVGVDLKFKNLVAGSSKVTLTDDDVTKTIKIDANITKTDIGLSSVDNTSDVNKPISTLQQAAIDLKVDKVAGKGLSAEDYTSIEKSNLSTAYNHSQVAHAPSNAEQNVNADWNSETGASQILNKPTIPTNLSDLLEDDNHNVVTLAEKSDINHTNRTAINKVVDTGDGTKFLASDGEYKAVNVGESGIDLATACAISIALG